MAPRMMLYPAFILTFWTFAMAAVMIRRAFDAVNKGGLNPEYFRYGAGFDAPHSMRSAYLLYSNLFEMPVLFYLAIVFIYITDTANALLLTLEWAYVAFRIVHSFTLLDNRNIKSRRNAFLASVMVLLLMWAVLCFRITLAPR